MNKKINAKLSALVEELQGMLGSNEGGVSEAQNPAKFEKEFGLALDKIRGQIVMIIPHVPHGHPKAEEVKRALRKMKEDLEDFSQEFGV